ncbi:SpoIVB peptidase [Oscillospiraceae bacterium NSJ-54]|uniref:SpoIVB peptidase n=1 Tax=Zongyangia hominis TaxID=2763677 RepID=A0A926EBD9_9FIRM|nr:SpoIVB peptidase [Zongyangia hominis]
MIKKLSKFIFVLSAVMATALVAMTFYSKYALPDQFYVSKGQSLHIDSKYCVEPVSTGAARGNTSQASASENASYRMELRLFGLIPVKQVQVNVVDQSEVVVCGTPFGIKMFTDGVLVIGASDVMCDGSAVNPAKNAGIKVGDVIVKMNGARVYTNEDVGKIVSGSAGESVSVTYKRNGQTLYTDLSPALSDEDKGYKAGIWVRDSTAGIGTMTFYDPAAGVFGGLGHAICDVDTGKLMPLSSGDIVGVTITGVKKGEAGTPGELKGGFVESQHMGTLCANGETGVYGTIENAGPIQGKAMPVAFKQEIKEGKAKVITTLDGQTAQEYEVMIEKVNYNDGTPTKNMIVKITDPQLLSKAGGIVQGMSGSPLVQDGKLIGAVTHVFVNDPTKGYAIFAENMLSSAKNVENSVSNAA